VGNSTLEDPPEERKKPGHGPDDGKHERGIDLDERVNETESDSGTDQRVREGTTPSAKPCLEEPDAGNLHVRICGGPGGQPLGLPDYAKKASERGKTMR
jgi:hypothetical protein